MRTIATKRRVTGGLAASVARAASRQARTALRVGLPDGSPGWVNCATLLSDTGAFAAWRASLAEWLVE